MTAFQTHLHELSLCRALHGLLQHSRYSATVSGLLGCSSLSTRGCGWGSGVAREGHTAPPSLPRGPPAHPDSRAGGATSTAPITASLITIRGRSGPGWTCGGGGMCTPVCVHACVTLGCSGYVAVFHSFFLAVPRGLWDLSSPTRD